MDNNILISSGYVANSVLKKIKEEKYNIPISPLKLYNLIFLSYAHYFYKTGVKLFTEQFVVTKKGPVLPYVYTKFNSYGNTPIKEYCRNSVGEGYFLSFNSDFDDSLTEIIDRYALVNDRQLLSIILELIPNENVILEDNDIIKAEELRRINKEDIKFIDGNKENLNKKNKLIIKNRKISSYLRRKYNKKN